MRRIKIILAMVCLLGMLLSTFTGCCIGIPSASAEDCAKEYVRAVISGDVKKATELNAYGDYEFWRSAFAKSFEEFTEYYPEAEELLYDYYKTKDIEKILDKAAKALLENEKERLNGENVEFFVFEEESYKGKDMYYIIQDCNDEFLDEVGSGYMDFSSLKVDTNSVSEVRKFTIIHERDEYTGYVANINGKWRVMEIEMLAWVFDDWGETAIDPLW